MIIKNIDTHDIEYPYNGTTYIFPKGESVSINDEAGDYITKTLPLSFSFGLTLQKEKAPEVKSYKTKVFLANQPVTEDMRVNKSEVITEEDEMQGQDWYGGGIEIDSLN